LQEALLLIKEADMFSGAIRFAKEALANDRQPPIA
jgi:hypothetical protein